MSEVKPVIDDLASLLSRAAAHKSMALAALRKNSSEKVRQRRYSEQMAKSDALIQAAKKMEEL